MVIFFFFAIKRILSTKSRIAWWLCTRASKPILCPNGGGVSHFIIQIIIAFIQSTQLLFFTLLFLVNFNWMRNYKTPNITKISSESNFIQHIQLLILQPHLFYLTFLWCDEQQKKWRSHSTQKKNRSIGGWQAGYKIFNKFSVYKNSVYIFHQALEFD